MSWLSSVARKAKKWQPGKTLKSAAPVIGGVLGQALIPIPGWGAAIGSSVGKLAQKGTKAKWGEVLKSGAGAYAGSKLMGPAISRALGRGGDAAVQGVQGPGSQAMIPSLAGAPAAGGAAQALTSSVSLGDQALSNWSPGGGGWGGAISNVAQKGMTNWEKAQIATTGAGAMASAYGAKRQGDVADKQFAMEQQDRTRRNEEEDRIRKAMQAAYGRYQSEWRRWD